MIIPDIRDDLISFLMGIFKNNKVLNSMANTVNQMVNNRHDRNVNRDNLQAAVMEKTGLNTQADKYNMVASLSKDGASTHTNMSWGASAMVSNIFGGKLGGMFKGASTQNADGSTTTTKSSAGKWLLIIGGSILAIFGIKKLFGKKRKSKKRR